MNQPDDELQKNTCVEKLSTRNISAEQLRRLLSDQRSGLQKAHFEMLQTAGRMKKQIAVIDELLAELTTG